MSKYCQIYSQSSCCGPLQPKRSLVSILHPNLSCHLTDHLFGDVVRANPKYEAYCTRTHPIPFYRKNPVMFSTTSQSLPLLMWIPLLLRFHPHSSPCYQDASTSIVKRGHQESCPFGVLVEDIYESSDGKAGSDVCCAFFLSIPVVF